MRLLAAGGTSDGGHCCKCAVPGALLFSLRAIFFTGAFIYDMWTGHKDKKNYEDETHHPSTGSTDGGGGC